MKKQVNSTSQGLRTISDLFQSNVFTVDNMKHLIGGGEEVGGTSTTPNYRANL
jgi:hypothetical protein